MRALEQTGGVRKRAATLLGISFRSLRYRLQKLGIDKGGDKERRGGRDEARHSHHDRPRLLRSVLGSRARPPEQRVDIVEPYAPSPTGAPIISLGYREAFADLFWIRLTGYFGGPDSTADGIASLVEAIDRARSALPTPVRVRRARDHDRAARRHAGQLPALARDPREGHEGVPRRLEAADARRPDLHAGSRDHDPAQRRAWDERGTLLTESAIRKPGAPTDAATWVAFMQTKLGQRERAIQDLREMILVTRDEYVAQGVAREAREARR